MIPPSIELTLVAIVGLVVGSFLNVVIHRLPRKESVVLPASRCPNCGSAIRWTDNIPVLSYAILRGRCRDCRAPISVRYPLVEAATCLLFVAHYLALGPGALLLVRLLFSAAMVTLFTIDLEHQLLPNVITLPGILVGLGFAWFLPPGLRSALIGLVVGGGFLWLVGEAYYRSSGHEGMGGGDVKMLAMVGAFLGWKLTLLTLVLSSIVGSLVGLAIIVSRRGGMKSAMPFGTFLAVAACVSSIAGDRIMDWYMSL